VHISSTRTGDIPPELSYDINIYFNCDQPGRNSFKSARHRAKKAQELTEGKFAICDGLCPITQDKIGYMLNVLRTN
jgi:hypothetical protein